MTDLAPDPRRRRIFMICAALLARGASWNIDWWNGEAKAGGQEISDAQE